MFLEKKEHQRQKWIGKHASYILTSLNEWSQCDAKSTKLILNEADLKQWVKKKKKNPIETKKSVWIKFDTPISSWHSILPFLFNISGGRVLSHKAHIMVKDSLHMALLHATRLW